MRSERGQVAHYPYIEGHRDGGEADGQQPYARRAVEPARPRGPLLGTDRVMGAGLPLPLRPQGQTGSLGRHPHVLVAQLEPDQELPDQLDPDQLEPDHELPDQELPGQLEPDQELPDQLEPDHELPDQLDPDQLEPDQLEAHQQAPVHCDPFHMPPDQELPDQLEPDHEDPSHGAPMMSNSPRTSVPSSVDTCSDPRAASKEPVPVAGGHV